MTIITILNPDGTAFGVERRELAHHITKTGIFFIDPNEANEIQWASTDKRLSAPVDLPAGIRKAFANGTRVYLGEVVTAEGRVCGFCGVAIYRKRNSNGRLENTSTFRTRRFCNSSCFLRFEYAEGRGPVHAMTRISDAAKAEAYEAGYRDGLRAARELLLGSSNAPAKLES